MLFLYGAVKHALGRSRLRQTHHTRGCALDGAVKTCVGKISTRQIRYTRGCGLEGKNYLQKFTMRLPVWPWSVGYPALSRSNGTSRLTGIGPAEVAGGGLLSRPLVDG